MTRPLTHLALPLVSKSGSGTWGSNVTVVSVTTGAVVATASVSAPTGKRLGSQWTVVSLGSALAPGVYTVALAGEDGWGKKASDSWFLAPQWVYNGLPSAGGGASQATYGNTPQWLRNPSASPFDPRLSQVVVGSVKDAIAHEVQRVKAVTGPLGRSFADVAALLLSYDLALSSQVPTRAPGGYDVFVIPDKLFRGSLSPDVVSGCSYYDLLRIGFASSYIGLRVLEGLMAYAQLQSAGYVPSSCPSGSAFGADNAHAFTTGALPCYTAQEVASAVATVKARTGEVFGDANTGEWVDWFGCEAMEATGGNVSACGLQFAVNGSGPAALSRVSTGFLPTAALAAKLGVPLGGVSVGATLAVLEQYRCVWGAGKCCFTGSMVAFWLLRVKKPTCPRVFGVPLLCVYVCVFTFVCVRSPVRVCVLVHV